MQVVTLKFLLMQGVGGERDWDTVVVVSRLTEEVAALNSGPGMARGESPAGGSSWCVNVRGEKQAE